VDNRKFWNERYKTLPELGSGPGSRGSAALRKQEIFKQLVEQNNAHKIVDIGCGDVSWYKQGLLGEVSYVGLDISSVVIEKNSKKFPELSFICHDISACIPKNIDSDVCVCFDVLLHQCDEEKFMLMLKNIIAITGKHALISYPTINEGQENMGKIVQTKDESKLDDELIYLLSQLDEDRPRGSVRVYSDIQSRILKLDPTVSIRRVAQFRTHPLDMGSSHTIYELVRNAEWLNLSGLEWSL